MEKIKLKFGEEALTYPPQLEISDIRHPKNNHKFSKLECELPTERV